MEHVLRGYPRVHDESRAKEALASSTRHAWPDPTQPRRLDRLPQSVPESWAGHQGVRPSKPGASTTLSFHNSGIVISVSAKIMPRTLHPSAMSGWMCLAHAGGAVRVGAETHRRVEFFV